SEPSSEKGKAACYETEFGALPPASVTHIQAKQVMIGDSAQAWLRFEATPEVVDSLLKRFAPSDRYTFNANSGGGNTPGWWKPDSDHLTAFYVAEGWRKDFGGSHAVIAHDAGKRLVYFCHSASD
ncbi:MAG TPA: hypothetical protein VGE67_06700, partial [Haloferula sp.]